MKIVILGTGNIGTCLTFALKNAGHDIVQLFNRTRENAVHLSKKLSIPLVSHMEELDPCAEIYILAVSDKALPQVTSDFPYKDKMVVHVSGSMDIEILKNYFKCCGVFYPLQTFSKQRSPNFENVPIFIEASSEKTGQILHELASSLSGKVDYLESSKRKLLHTSAVFCCNFVNHMLAIGEEMLIKQDIPFSIMESLVRETIEKAFNNSPHLVQTGPAVRGDKETLRLHEEVLSNEPEKLEIYKVISKNISNFQHEISIKKSSLFHQGK